MKRVGSRTPFWVMRSAQLRGAAKKFKLAYGKGAVFKIVFIDIGEAISAVMVRPLFVRQDEEDKKKIWARFDLFDPFTNAKIPLNLVYHRGLDAFVYEIPGNHVVLATGYPGIDYFDDETREKMTKRWLGEKVEEEEKENKPCPKTKTSSSARSRSEPTSFLEIREPSVRVVRTLFSE